jgi:hypothetical protein
MAAPCVERVFECTSPVHGKMWAEPSRAEPSRGAARLGLAPVDGKEAMA